MHVPAPVDHARHDPDLIAALVAGDLADPQRIRADALLQSCTVCADLRRDLIAIAAATRGLPRTLPAPRDFRLDALQASRLRRHSWLRGLLQPFGAPRSAVRPMAAAFTTLGIAGLLLTSILPSMLGGVGGGAPAALDREQTTGQAAPSSAPEALRATDAAVRPVANGPQASVDANFGAAAQASALPSADRLQIKDQGSGAPVAMAGGAPSNDAYASPLNSQIHGALQGQTNPLLIGSIALLALGLVLFTLRFAARRVR